MPDFELPPAVRFTCTGCGDCCRGWDVPLGPGELERLQALDWPEEATEWARVRPGVRVRGGASGVKHRLPRRPDGSCAYLTSAARCAIHEHFGPEAKPLACRIYPFGFTNVGGRVAVDAAFSCKAISEGRGESLEARVPEWTRLLEERGGPPAEGRHRLDGVHGLSGELLHEIEHHLVETMVDRELDLVDRVRCCLEFARLGTTGDPTTEAARSLRTAIARGLRTSIPQRAAEGTMDRTQRAVFFQWLHVALNPPPSGLSDLPPRELQAERQRRIRAGRAYEKSTRRPWIDDRELRVTFAEVADVDAVRVRRDPDHLLEQFFVAKIVGQRFLAAPSGEAPLVPAVTLLFLALPMIAWTAKALAAEAGLPVVGEEELRAAVRRIDRIVGQLSTGDLPKPQAKAFDHVLHGTDLVVAATRDVLATS